MRHLALRLESPLMSFGGESVDNLGVTRRFPSASMISGLLANALGLRRVQRAEHQRLQERLAFAARIERDPYGGASMRDFQTAQLSAQDKGWTTRGEPEGRAGGSLDAPHLRYRDYLADLRVMIALRLDPAREAPTLDDLAAALDEPARPLFIGRKPCLPSESLLAGFCEGDSALGALMSIPLADVSQAPARISLWWPASESASEEAAVANEVRTVRRFAVTDERNWATSGLHGGARAICEGTVERSAFAVAQSTETSEQ